MICLKTCLMVETEKEKLIEVILIFLSPSNDNSVGGGARGTKGHVTDRTALL